MSELFAAWLPFIILVVVFVVLSRLAQRSYKKHVDDVNAVNQAIVDTNRGMIAELREIKQILKDRT
ncbi:hypothetical protein [Pelagibacterium sp.]|uniref:hypothetical protein n=1 Tax=Pelagibacterium sp. TaxID=1967288 RepID=UPI003A943430